MTPRTKAGSDLYGWLKWARERLFAGVPSETLVRAIEDEMLDKVAAAVSKMKACAPDGDYIRWDVEYVDPSLHYVNREGLLAAIERIRRDDDGR